MNLDSRQISFSSALQRSPRVTLKLLAETTTEDGESELELARITRSTENVSGIVLYLDSASTSLHLSRFAMLNNEL